jgi:hypothetical protein
MKREEKFEDTEGVSEYTSGAMVCVLAYPFGIFKLFFSFHLFALAVVLKVKTMHVNQRTDNTIAKRKRTIAQTKD